MIATLDIETAAPVLTPEQNRALVKVQDAWRPETVEAKRSDPELLRAARYALATDVTRCLIVGGAIALDDRPPEWMGLADLLDTLDDIGDALLVGHGIDGFDLPALTVAATRARHRVARRLWRIMGAKPWDRPTRDTMQATTLQGAFGRSVFSLDRLADLLGVAGPAPGTISGADCPAAYDDGRIDAIAAHCLDDVKRERAVYLRLCEVGLAGWALPGWAR